jgi:ParB family chromosome partitioning protein
MRHEYRSVPLDLIDVPADRVRPVNPDRVATLSADIAANGLLQPIGVVEEEGGRFALTFGAHRLAAVRALKRHEIDARVTPAAWIKAQERRLQEVMENLDRQGLTKLERAESLALLKIVHEELYPETRKGVAGGKARQNSASEIFSFAKSAAEKTGLSRRAIEIAVAIVVGLAADVQLRLRGTWLEDHQAGLQQLSKQTPELQHRVCDLLFATPPEAASVADAIVLAEGGRLKSNQERLLTSVANNFARLSDRDQRAVLEANEEAVRAYALEKGWI